MVIERPTCSLAGQQINIITEMKYNYYMDVLLLASATYFSLILSLYVLAHILHTEDEIGLYSVTVFCLKANTTYILLDPLIINFVVLFGITKRSNTFFGPIITVPVCIP